MNTKSSARPLDADATPPAAAKPRPGVARQARGWARSVDWSFGVPLAILLALAVAYLLMQPTAFSMSTLASNLNDAMPLILVGAGQTMVIICGSIDISVGGVIALVNVLAATHLSGGAPSLIAWSLVLLALGAAIGAFNGVLIGVGRLSPVIVTIATWSICSGIALFVLNSPGGNVAPAYQSFWSGSVGWWPNALTLLLVLLLLWALFQRTRAGVSLYATGSDAEAARLTGVPVWRIQALAFTLSGALSALAALFLVASQASGDATIGAPFILNSIAAVVIGGTPITGGRGGIARSAVGACIFIVVQDVIFAANVSSFLTPLVTGLILLAVVTISVLGPTALARVRGHER